MMNGLFNLNDAKAAHSAIAPHIKRTPLIKAERLEAQLGCRVFLKPEMLQVTGSFKPRGALNKCMQLSKQERSKGLITSSSGNHAQALAYAGKLLDAKTIVVVPHDAPKFKIDRARALGAQVVEFEGPQLERWALVDRMIEEEGYTMVHASDDPAVMAGQGTAGLEILQDLYDVDTVVVPLGGGGLLSGLAVALKESAPHIRIVGVEPCLAPKYHESRKNGNPTKVIAGTTIADGIREENTGKNAYPIIEKYVDELVLVDDAYIIRALKLLLEETKLFAEGAAAAGLAAVLAGEIKVKAGENVCFLLSAGNWDMEKFISICGEKAQSSY